MPPRRKGHKLTNPPSREKHLEWARLRREGWGLAEIAEQSGVSRQAVHKAIRALMQESVRESTAELIELESERLDALQRNVWTQATTPGDDGQLPAVDRVLRIMERRANLFALDGAAEPANDNETREVPIDELRELLDGLGYKLVRKDGEEDDGDTE